MHPAVDESGDPIRPGRDWRPLDPLELGFVCVTDATRRIQSNVSPCRAHSSKPCRNMACRMRNIWKMMGVLGINSHKGGYFRHFLVSPVKRTLTKTLVVVNVAVDHSDQPGSFMGSDACPCLCGGTAGLIRNDPQGD